MKIAITGTEYYWGKRMLNNLLNNDEIDEIIALDIKSPKIQSKKLKSAKLTFKPPFNFEWLKELENFSPDILLLCPFSFDYCYHDDQRRHLAGVQNSLRVFREALKQNIPKIIVLSSCLAYGARYSNPVYIHEDDLLLGDRRYEHIRSIIELEESCLAAIATGPEKSIIILRPALVLGPTIDNSMTRFFKLPVIPYQFGFDPVMQFIHEDDVVRAIIHAIKNDANGPFNIACNDFITFSQLCTIIGKKRVPLFHIAVDLLSSRLWRYRLSQFSPAFMNLIKYRVVMDISKSKELLNFQAEYSVKETILSFKKQLED